MTSCLPCADNHFYEDEQHPRTSGEHYAIAAPRR